MDHYGYKDQRDKAEINLQDYLAIILKRKWTVISFALVMLTTVTIGTFRTKPTYTAKGTLLLEKEANILSFQDIFQIETFSDDYFQTQYKLLQSRTLANDTIDRLKLYENEKFIGKINNTVGIPDKSDTPFRERLIENFLGRLGIEPISQTRLVEVNFKANDPQFAAEVLNAFFDSFIDMNIQKKFLATEQATEFLASQISSIRAEIEEREKKLGEYGAEKNIIALSDKETTIVEKLGQFNRALTEAQLDRVNKETYYSEIRVASPDYIPEALTNPLIQKLREDYARLTREYLKKSETFKPEYPEMQRLKAELDSATESLKIETQNLIKGAYSDYQAALKREQSLESVFNKQKQEAIQLNSNAILYNSLRIELENKKSLLDSLSKRQSETGVSARLKGLRTSNVWIVDRATAPLSPSSPKKKRNIALALIIGLFGGLGLAFLFERLDNSVKNFQDVEKYAGVPSLGIVPTFSPDGFRKLRAKEAKASGVKLRVKEPHKSKRKPDSDQWLLGEKKEGKTETREPEAAGLAGRKEVELPEAKSIELITHSSPNLNISENYRSIRTTLLLSRADSALRCFVVSSPLPQEGKTATISNLAVTFAQAGKKVLLIDADLRKPKQHRIFQIKNLTGLTNYLSSQADLKDLEKATQIPNLYLINAGPLPPNPVELLGSERMGSLIDGMKQRFDYILFDSPPLLPVSDAVVLGPKIDGMILVIRGGKTTREALKRAKEKLDMHQIKCAGVIINSISLKENDYYYMKHYYHYYGQHNG
jgi:capsular exopolysaccharide synthesis family protein